MFIYFDAATRRVNHVVNLHPVDYKPMPGPGEDWIKTDEDYAFDEIEILEDKTLRRRQPLALTYPSSVETGVEFTILGVPEGVTISVNGVELGVMDTSELIDFTAETGGFYKFRFEGPGVITTEIDIEAHG